MRATILTVLLASLCAPEVCAQVEAGVEPEDGRALVVDRGGDRLDLHVPANERLVFHVVLNMAIIGDAVAGANFENSTPIAAHRLVRVAA